MTPELATKTFNTAQQLVTIPTIIFVLVGGYLFDIFGRRFTTYYSLLVTGAILVFFPLAAPDANVFTGLVLAFSIANSPVSSSNPLLQDYCDEESFGKANSL